MFQILISALLLICLYKKQVFSIFFYHAISCIDIYNNDKNNTICSLPTEITNR